ncbi:MAG: hypothetical protein C0508_25345, partial [Cyanobacteria bacterium PR.023]|nr:hypothetical protein [Cyanobacteria bacterium PR.023]
MSEFCKACGKPPVATRAGSLTSYFFQHNYCQCQRRRAGFGTIHSTNLAGSDAAGVCSNCGKSRPSKRRAGSFTAFLFKDLRCVCAGPSEMSQLARNKAPQVDRLNSIHGRSSTAVRVVKRKQFTESLRQAVGPQTGAVSIFPPGAVIGGAFKIITMIGQGGMGVVYLAEHSALSRQVALKTLAPELVNEQSWLRFKEEAKTLAALNHKSLVNVYDLAIHDKIIPYYSMDFLDGESLEELLLSAVELPLSKALPIFLEMLDGLAYAHRNGIVHRDIKPGNIMVCTVNGVKVVKILDFGISKLVGPNAVRSQGLTSAGEIFGSAFYMSPEQCSGGRVDARSDIYSVGCTLFEVLTGFVPFEGSSFIETAIMHQEEEIPRLSQLRPDLLLPKSIDLVLAKCMAKSPEDRYQSAKELALDLTRVLEGKEVFITEKVLLPESGGGPDSTTNSQSTPLPVLPILAALGLVASIAMVSILLILKPIDRVVPRSHVASTPVASSPVASSPVASSPVASSPVASTRVASTSAEDSFAGLIREQLLSQSSLDRIGASPKEKEFFSTFDWSSETSYEQRYQKIADDYMKATATTEAAPIKFKGIGVFK